MKARIAWGTGAVVAILMAGASLAQGPGDRPPPGRTRELAVPAAAVPPVIDGLLDDAAWKTAAKAEDFWISIQGRRPTEQTVVLVTADSTHLYIAFRCYDSEPDKIVALDTRRDASLRGEDQVSVELDPYLSYREVSSYSINARGTISDSIAGGRAGQIAWKGDWQGAAKRDEFGWTAELAIPFGILNFAAGTTTFGVNFLRYQNRTREWSQWADTTIQDLPEERGRLTGLVPSQSARRFPVAFMPFVVSGTNIEDRNGEVRDHLTTAGIDIRYQPRPNLTGVLSLNPDFSQVEEALTDIDFSYNERFRVDNRPFFQEGAAYFGDRAYFYSNRVPDFDHGAKVFSRTAGYQLGALATSSGDSRTDFAFQLQREFDAAHNAGLTAVGTDQRDLRNAVIAAHAAGRQSSGFIYDVKGGASQTEQQAGDGSFVAGSVGLRKDYWILEVAGHRYSREYRPELGLIDDDLLDTIGTNPSLSYYRDFGSESSVREVSAGANWEYRETGDGRVQQSNESIGGSVEFQRGIALGLSVSGGSYRPLVDDKPGAWGDELNQDHYYSTSVDFNTRSSRLRYGLLYAGGQLGGGDYGYSSAYVKSRPTATTSLAISAERLSYFGTYRQVITTAGWDVTPRHGIYARYIWAEGDDYFRFAYSWRFARNIDVFAVYDDSPDTPEAASIKLLVTLP